MRGYPQFSFWISIGLVKIYISCIITHREKNIFNIVGTVLNVKTWVPFPAQLDIFLPCVGLKSLTPWINEVSASVSFRVNFNFSLQFTVD